MLVGTLIPLCRVGIPRRPELGIIFGNVLASLFYGAAMVAIGVFISSLTVSQIIAAIGTLAAALFLVMINVLGTVTGERGSDEDCQLDLL